MIKKLLLTPIVIIFSMILGVLISIVTYFDFIISTVEDLWK